MIGEICPKVEGRIRSRRRTKPMRLRHQLYCLKRTDWTAVATIVFEGQERSMQPNRRPHSGRKAKSALSAALSIIVGGLLCFPATAHAEKDYVGADEYRTSCLACHGADGRGNGPTAQYLKVKPADLTQLSKKNGGPFPFRKIMRIIDGRDKNVSIRLHGSAMPLWGTRYKYEAVLSGENPGYSELLAGIRILKLVIYIQSIQQK